MNISIFSAKEEQIIELMNPGKTAQEVVEIVLRNWLDSNLERLYSSQKSREEKLDEIIAAKLDKGVVK